MKINFGCGRRVTDGFYNIDAVYHPQAMRPPELIHAITFDAEGRVENPLPLADGCADELHAYHVIEHVYEWEARHLLHEWKRVLKPSGRLVLELPNLEAAARNLLAGMDPQMSMWPLYGDPGHRSPWMCHRWGYTPRTAGLMLGIAGFVNVAVLPPQTHGARLTRDMRVEARKP